MAWRCVWYGVCSIGLVHSPRVSNRADNCLLLLTPTSVTYSIPYIHRNYYNLSSRQKFDIRPRGNRYLLSSRHKEGCCVRRTPHIRTLLLVACMLLCRGVPSSLEQKPRRNNSLLRSPANSFLAASFISTTIRTPCESFQSDILCCVVVGSATNPIDGRIRVVVGSSGVSNHTMKPASAIVVAFPGLLGCGGTLSASSSSSSSSS